MEPIGTDLKSEREKRQIGLSQIAQATRISLHHLESLEEGRYADLPGGIYNRAFLKAYCEHLGLDSQALLHRYESEVLPSLEKSPKLEIDSHQSRPSPSPIVTWTLMFLVSATGLFLSRHWIASVFSPYFPGASNTTGQHLPVEPATPPTSTEDHSTPSTSVAEPEISAIQQTPKTGIDGAEPVQPPDDPMLRVELEVTQQCWISINSDGRPPVERILQPGDEQSFVAVEHLFIILGNAGGVHLKINGKPARPLGKAGEVVRLLINEDNINNFLEATAG